MNIQELVVTNNRAMNRFEVPLGDTFGEITYRKEGNVYYMYHTGVPDEYSGQGIGQYLVHEALEQVKAENGLIVPQCSFISLYLRRHPEYQSLVAS